VNTHKLWRQIQAGGDERDAARRAIGDVLLRCGTAEGAAKHLGITRTTLIRWLQGDVRRPDDPPPGTGAPAPLAELWEVVRKGPGRPMSFSVLGRSRAEVATELGISRQALDKRLKRQALNYERRRRALVAYLERVPKADAQVAARAFAAGWDASGR
jgi:transposase